MKKNLVILLVLLLLAVTVVPVFASNSGENTVESAKIKKPSPFALAGTIASIDSTARTVTVTIVCGNAVVKPFIGKTLTLTTNLATRFLLHNLIGTATPLSFGDLAVGQKISANGVFANAVWTARRITVGADLNCLP